MSILRKGALVVLSGILVVGLMGCRDTDALKEIIYDQTSTNIDYDNPTKFYISDETAEQESDQVSASEVNDDNAPNTTNVQNLVVYSSTPNTQGFTAKQSIFDKYADFKGLEPSVGTLFYYSTADNAIYHEVDMEVEPPEEEQEEEEEEEESPSDEGQATGKGTGTGDGNGQGQGTGTGAVDDEEADEPSEGESENTDPTEEGDDPQPSYGKGGGGGGEINQKIDASDDMADLPPVSKIAACGQLAVMVQMIAGDQGCLVGADQNTASKIQSTFGDESTADISVIWDGDGETADTLDVDALLASGAQAVLCYNSGTYEGDGGLTQEQVDAIEEAGITFVTMAELASTTYIKKDVKAIGDMLSEATGGSSSTMAQKYADFHDSTVDAAINANGGGVAGDQVFETHAYNCSINGDTLYTLLVDGYDTNAVYGGDYYGWTPDCTGGVALASIGWAKTPINMYIQAGGMVNNAVDQGTEKESGYLPVWQFSNSFLKFIENKWEVEPEGVAWNVVKKASAFERSLLNVYASVDSGSMDSSIGGGTAYNFGFGSSDYPKIIVTKQAYKDAMIANSQVSNGIYRAYPYVEAGNYGALGIAVDNHVLYACIGATSSDCTESALPDGSIPSEDIVVNPSSLISGSWVNPSVESFLESVWVADRVNPNISLDCTSYISEFYSTFYRCSVSVDTVLAGE